MGFKNESQIQIKILNNTINLDHPCWVCVKSSEGYGYGSHKEPETIYGFEEGYDHGEPCASCDNKRFVLTSAGLGLVELMDRYGSPHVASSVVPITTFAPEPYQLTRDIPVVVTLCGDSFTASFVDANVGSSGDTLVEAVSNLKELLLDVFETLTNESDANLGPEPLRQKSVLSEFIVRT